MKTKMLLSIAMLVISMMGYASERTNIPLEKIQYALDHPGTAVTIDSSTITQNLLYIADKTTVKQIVYKDGIFRNLAPRITQAPYVFDWAGVLVFLIILFVLVLFVSAKVVFAGLVGILMMLYAIIEILEGDVTLLIGSLIVICIALAIYIGLRIGEKETIKK